LRPINGSLSKPEITFATKSCPGSHQWSNTKASWSDRRKTQRGPESGPFGKGCVLISWEDERARVQRCESPLLRARKRCVSQGRSGQTEIRWLWVRRAYDFRLYARSQPTATDSVEVKREFESVPVMLQRACDEVLRGKSAWAHLSQFWQQSAFTSHCQNFLNPRHVIPRCLHSGKSHGIFPLWEAMAFMLCGALLPTYPRSRACPTRCGICRANW